MLGMICKTVSKHMFLHLQFIWWQRDYRMFCAVLPSSLRALNISNGGKVSLPDLGHLTALTELRLGGVILTPAQERLPHLPALQVLSLECSNYEGEDVDTPGRPVGPPDLDLAFSAPLLTEFCLELGKLSDPHEQLAALASLTELRTIVLDFRKFGRGPFGRMRVPAENKLRQDTLLTLPVSITKLVLCEFESCVPTVALPKNMTVVIEPACVL